MSAVIEVSGLTVRFGEITAVDDVDLTVRSGEVFGFLGPNGAGKTTTMRTLLDLQRPHGGTVRVLGREVCAAGGALRASVGYLPGDLALFPGLRGSETPVVARASSVETDATGERTHARAVIFSRASKLKADVTRE